MAASHTGGVQDTSPLTWFASKSVYSTMWLKSAALAVSASTANKLEPLGTSPPTWFASKSRSSKETAGTLFETSARLVAAGIVCSHSEDSMHETMWPKSAALAASASTVNEL